MQSEVPRRKFGKNTGKTSKKMKKALDFSGKRRYNKQALRADERDAQDTDGDLHNGSATDSDSVCGSSILSSPTRTAAAFAAAVFFSGCSAVGSALGSGPRGRGFESRHSDLIKRRRNVDSCVFFVVLVWGLRKLHTKITYKFQPVVGGCFSCVQYILLCGTGFSRVEMAL